LNLDPLTKVGLHYHDSPWIRRRFAVD